MNRRQALRTMAAGGAAGLVTAGAVVAAGPPEKVHDPLAEAILAFQAERDAAFAIPQTETDKEFEEAYNERVRPLFFAIEGLAPTTMAGAILGLRFLRDDLNDGPGSLDGSLIDGVTAFLEGKAS